MGHVPLGETEEGEDDGDNFLHSFEDRCRLTGSQHTDLSLECIRRFVRSKAYYREEEANIKHKWPQPGAAAVMEIAFGRPHLVHVIHTAAQLPLLHRSLGATST